MTNSITNANIFYFNKFKIICLLFLLIHTIASNAQSKLDKEKILRNELQYAKADTAKARLSSALAWLLKFDKQNEALQLANDAIKIGYKLNKNTPIAQGYKIKAFLFSLKDSMVASLAYYDSCIYYCIKEKNYYELAHCYSLLAGIYADFGDYDKALEIHTNALVEAQKSKSSYMIAVCSNNLASVSRDAGRKFENILVAFLTAKENFIKLNDWIAASVASVNIAHVYVDINQPAKASLEMKESMDFKAMATPNDYENATICNEYATIFYKLNEYKEAEKYAIISYNLLSKLNVPDNLLAVQNNLVKINIVLNNKDKAEFYAQEMLALALPNKAKLYITNAYKAMSEIEEYKNNPTKSLAFYKQYKAWDDSIFNDAKEKIIANIESKAILAQKENEIKYNSLKNNRENELLKIKNSSLKRQKIIGIVACVLLGILGVSLFLSNKTKQKINTDLELQKRKVEMQSQEKGILIQEIHHRVKNNLTMLKGLLYLQAKASTEPETKNILKESQARIQSMALVHQNLYDDKDANKLNLVSFTKNLFEDIISSYHTLTKEIELNVEGGCPDIDISKLIPLSLILNELATNSLKYAFGEKEVGKIAVQISSLNNIVQILYSDNGVGLPANVSLVHGGFGFKLLNLLAKQLNADVTYKYIKDQCTFTILIPL